MILYLLTWLKSVRAFRVVSSTPENDATGEIVAVQAAENGSFSGQIHAQLGDEIKIGSHGGRNCTRCVAAGRAKEKIT